MNSMQIMKMKPENRPVYRNVSKTCSCGICERENRCPVAHREQRLPRDKGGQGLCRKL